MYYFCCLDTFNFKSKFLQKMEDQFNKPEGKAPVNKLETQVNQNKDVIEELKNDIDRLQVAGRLQKRLETNLDKLVNKLDLVIEQIPNAAESCGNQEKLEARFTQLEQCYQSNVNHLQQCITYKGDENIKQMQTEFNWMKDQLKLMKEEQELISSKVQQLSACIEDINDVPSKDGFIWVINGIESKLKWPTMAEWSPVFKLYGHSFGAQALMQTKNNDIFIYLSFRDTGKFRAFSKLKFLPRVSFSLCDINVNHETNDIIKFCDPQFGNSNYQYSTNYYSLFLCNKIDVISPKYIFNDSITVKIAVNSIEDAEPPASTNGSLTWTIDNYQKKRKLEESRFISCQHSPSFYTSEKGYRVKAELELRFGTLKLRIFFINGEFDSDLSAAFSHNTTVTLVDQTPTWLSRNDRVVSIRKSNIQDRSYELNLSLKSDLNDFKDNYLRDDSIIIKIDIQHSVPS